MKIEKPLTVGQMIVMIESMACHGVIETREFEYGEWVPLNAEAQYRVVMNCCVVNDVELAETINEVREELARENAQSCANQEQQSF